MFIIQNCVSTAVCQSLKDLGLFLVKEIALLSNLDHQLVTFLFKCRKKHIDYID
jgi:hypothetical protein